MFKLVKALMHIHHCIAHSLGRYGLSPIEPSHAALNTDGKSRAVLIGLRLHPRPINTALGFPGGVKALTRGLHPIHNN